MISVNNPTINRSSIYGTEPISRLSQHLKEGREINKITYIIGYVLFFTASIISGPKLIDLSFRITSIHCIPLEEP